ncbi:hypothetical protein GCM10009836_44840 [Pseudonocardia ailaonensis]|uniref:Uncharacterized protein n=1 Tax=Pseudonocardia ailaonensis TaxID=367279 RepID=A0ABN2N9X9_9PSEU
MAAPSIDAHSLILDGSASLSESSLRITPVRAVLHRPAPAHRPVAGCAADCVEIGGT